MTTKKRILPSDRLPLRSMHGGVLTRTSRAAPRGMTLVEQVNHAVVGRGGMETIPAAAATSDTGTSTSPASSDSTSSDPDLTVTHKIRTQTTYTARPVLRGFGGDTSTIAPPSPHITWRVGDQQVTSHFSLFSVLTPMGIFSLSCTVDPDTAALTLVSAPGDRYDIPVIATAVDPASGAWAVAVGRFAPVGGR